MSFSDLGCSTVVRRPSAFLECDSESEDLLAYALIAGSRIGERMDAKVLAAASDCTAADFTM